MKQIFSPRNKKVLFFDLNGTLIDPKQSFRLHFVQLIEEFIGRSANSESFQVEKIVSAYEREWVRMKRKYKQVKRSKLQQLCLKKILKPYPFDLSEQFTTSFFKELRSRQKKEPVLFRNALPVLTSLHKKYKIAIISNSGLGHLEKLGLNGIIHENHLFTAKKCGVRKPNRAIFDTALKEMGIKPKQAIMIGNSWRNDIQSALLCGMDAIWIRPSAPRIRTIRRASGNRAIQIQHIQQLTAVL